MIILVVDDDPEFRKVMECVLAGEGWDAVLAENGEEALVKLKGMTIDMVISDIYMPVMNGLKFHKLLRAQPEFAKLPFLFMSGHDDQYTLEVLQDPNWDGFLRKGRPMEDLIDCIRYLTTSLDNRPKVPPVGFRYKFGMRTPRVLGRGSSTTPIL